MDTQKTEEMDSHWDPLSPSPLRLSLITSMRDFPSMIFTMHRFHSSLKLTSKVEAMMHGEM